MAKPPKRCRVCGERHAPGHGKRSTWSLEDARKAGEPKSYPRTALLPIGVMPPKPRHAQTAGAEAAVEALRAAGRAKLVAAPVQLAAGPFPRPPDHPPPANALRLQQLAESVGMTAHIIEVSAGYRVEGYSLEHGVAFRADYIRGQAKAGATWHERRRRWGMMHDERPSPDAKVERTVGGRKRLVPHPNRMPEGLDRDHLSQTAGPEGVPVGVTEITKRLKELTR